MEVLLLIIVGLVVLAIVGSGWRSPSASADKGGRASREQRIIDANMDWLRERWRMADAEKAAGNLVHFPKWYFDDATDRQRSRLEQDGVNVSGNPTKGQASDIIGLFQDPETDLLEKLKFFDITLKGPLLNETRVRHEAAKLDSDPAKQSAWAQRPASALQKEFYRFIGERPPARLTFQQAEAYIGEAMEKLSEQQQAEWDAFESLMDEFEDREFRSDVEIRKPTPADIRAAMAALKAGGQDFDDPFDVAEKLLEMKPSLARAGT
ncbi:MAG: hypothetical protein ACT4PS_13840 [Betaproteobacteria bacterium]